MSIPLVVGVDGGGSKTVAWLARLHKPDAPARDNSVLPVDRIPSLALRACDPIGRGTAGPGNPRAAGFDAAQANIDAAIDAAFADAKLPRQAVAAACFGLAGCGRPAEQQQIASWAETRGIASRLKVTGDAEIVLAAAAPANGGIALICGTGSLAWGRNERGETARAGGWGYLIGDEGSGYAIALAGLRAAVRAADGRGPQTSLLTRLEQRLNAAAPADLVGRVYAPEVTREQIAALAETVFEAAASDDEAARDVVEQSAVHAAEMIAAVAQRLDMLASSYTLALAGGVLLHQPAYRQLISRKAAARSALPGKEIFVPEPVAGAVALARQLAAGR